MNKFISLTIISTGAALLFFCVGSSDLMAQGRKQSGPGANKRMHQPPTVDQVFAKDDKDGDSMISKDEFGGPPEHFSHLDTDGDGYLTREEVANAQKNPPRSHGSPPPTAENFKEHFTRTDTDGDGVISTEEFTGPAEHFTLIDADQDGMLTREELAGARDQTRKAPTNKGTP